MKCFTTIQVSPFVALLLCLTGCQSGQHGDLKQAVDRYNAQQYTQAHDQALQIQNRAKPGDREDAAYVAGLSAYQLGDRDEAERQLLIASTSSNQQTAARANAMLGQIRLDQRRPRDAATLLSGAAQNLEGDDAQKAAFNAAVAYQQAGDRETSKKWLDMSRSGQGQTVTVSPTALAASSQSPNRQTTKSPNTSDAGATFTLQVGAFREKSRAKRAADDAQKLSQREGLGEVRIVTRRDDHGKQIFLVQVGTFSTRDMATAARNKVGRLEYIVAATASTSL